MARIIGQMGLSALGYEDNPYLSQDLRLYSWSYQPTPHIAGKEVLSGRYSKFRVTAPFSWPVRGQESRAFFHDFYNRIHIAPSLISLGNLTSTQVRDVVVWNAYTTPKLLSFIQAVGADGLDLIEPIEAPTYFGATEERTYQLSISTNGPPVIDARYVFHFSDESPSLRVTGRRVVVWPFIPQVEHRETLEWLTDILPSFNNEQRLAVRQAPRQALTYEFQLLPHSFSRAKALATQWAHRVYGVPVWSELTRVGLLPAGITEVTLDTRNADYRDNDLILIWESDTHFVAAENLQVLPDRIVLKFPLEDTYQNAYVAPLRFARTPQGVSFRRFAHDITIANVSFQVTQNKDLAASAGYPQYRGKDVLTERSVIISDLAERISRSMDEFDNGSGPVIVDIQKSWVDSAKVVTFDTLSREHRWAVRGWLHSLRGRQRAFWLPSWNRDLTLVEDVGANGTTLVVRPIGYPLYYGVKDIMVQLKSGVQAFARVLGGATNSNGNEVLSLDVPLGVDAPVSEVDFICFMSHVRLNADRVEIQHTSAGRATISIPVVETPE